MKLAIPIDQKISEGHDIMAQSFTETDVLCIYDSESNNENTLLISELFLEYESENLINILKELGISSVISSQFMPMAMRFFERNNIKMLKPGNNKIKAIIDDFNENRLKEFTEADAVLAGCTGSCGSCNSTDCK